MDYLNDQTSPLVKRVHAYEQLQRVQKYLFDTTYGTPLSQPVRWEQWYKDIQDAVNIVRRAEQDARLVIAKRIGASLDCTEVK